MKRLFLLLTAMLLAALLPMTAGAVTAVPEGVTALEAEVFANTAIDALILPASVQTVGANVLSGCEASYLYLQGSGTVLANGANNGVPFVFGPSGCAASALPGFYPSETLMAVGGVYYSVADTALPLCAKEPASLAGSVTIPKLVDGVPVTDLETLYLDNTGVTELRLPAYLDAPSGMNAVPYQTIFVTDPVPDADTTSAGRYVTWTTSCQGAYGSVDYIWTFQIGGESHSVVTTEPTVRFAPMAEGECTAAVTVEDSLGDTATSAEAAVTVTPLVRTYRALLVGNTYPEGNPLQGPDNDIAAMGAVLRTMTGTPYQITTAPNLTASGIQGAIASAFAGAQPGDVSLFYFSGHGSSEGSLIGTNSTYLSVYSLRTALQQVPGTKIVLLDCCYSGRAIARSAGQTASASAFNQAVISAFAAAPRSSENLADAGFLVITACRENEESFSLGDGARYWGAFTYGICYGSGYDEWEQKALSGLPADADGNAAITLREAYDGARERISYLNSLTGFVTQEVQWYGDGSFVLWSR